MNAEETTKSWWCDKDRAAFIAAAEQELPRMRASKFGQMVGDGTFLSTTLAGPLKPRPRKATDEDVL